MRSKRRGVRTELILALQTGELHEEDIRRGLSVRLRVWHLDGRRCGRCREAVCLG